MKADLDRLMEEAGMAALLVVGPARHNPSMTYFTGPVNVESAYLLKVRGEIPVLFHGPMERDEAASTGLATRDIYEYPVEQFLEQAEGDRLEAGAVLLARIFADYGLRGRVALYGKTELGAGYGLFRRLSEMLEGIELVGESGWESLLSRSRTTKDPDEIDRIRRVGKSTVAVVGNVADFLTSHAAKDGVLVNGQGELLTVGEVKQRINLWLAMHGVENPEGTIFSVGREAGVPHSTGRDDQPVPVGKAIIFDLFPCEAGGGYFYDFTRTWAIGHASDELLQLHQDVLETYEAVYPLLKPNRPCRDLQIAACERFQAQGHSTVMQDRRTAQGYVHSLGHGLGLQVHESPSFSHLESNTDRLQPGMVFSFEPGLYYPERGMGARLEDTLWARPDGGFEVLAEYPKELVLKVMDG